MQGLITLMEGDSRSFLPRSLPCQAVQTSVGSLGLPWQLASSSHWRFCLHRRRHLLIRHNKLPTLHWGRDGKLWGRRDFFPLLPSLSLFMFTSVSRTSCLLSGEGRAQAAQIGCARSEKAAAPDFVPSASRSEAGSGPAVLAAHLNVWGTRVISSTYPLGAEHWWTGSQVPISLAVHLENGEGALYGHVSSLGPLYFHSSSKTYPKSWMGSRGHR